MLQPDAILRILIWKGLQGRENKMKTKTKTKTKMKMKKMKKTSSVNCQGSSSSSHTGEFKSVARQRGGDEGLV